MIFDSSLTGSYGYTVSSDYSKNFDSFYDSLIYSNDKTINNDFIYSIVMKNYPLADDTLCNGINRIPWMSDIKDGIKVDHVLPTHGHNIQQVVDIANTLKSKLEEEIFSVIKDVKSVGILLSGGMDSRIIASILYSLCKSKNFNGKITALTWGTPSSRDVQYAKSIAELYNWDFKFFELTPDTLIKNIYLTAEMGAEFSPIHLHEMSSISEVVGIDIILAGSYGDSIGRAEYSGKKVDKLPFILDNHLNIFGLFNPSLEVEALGSLKKKILSQRERFPDRTELEYREIEMQSHYMRRQLNSCMQVINSKIPVFQAFSSPSVYGYVWSIDNSLRNDDIYFHLLESCDSRLLEIPWARNGKIYNDPNSKVHDSFTSMNNDYGSWLRNECRDFIISEIKSGPLYSTNIFDNSMLDIWCRSWSKSNSSKADRLDEKMAWLASLSIALSKYQLTSTVDLNIKRGRLSQAYYLVVYKLYRCYLSFR